MNVTQLIHDLLKLGLKQRDICERTGLPQATVAHLNTGRRGKRPSYETASKLILLHAQFFAAARSLPASSATEKETASSQADWL